MAKMTLIVLAAGMGTRFGTRIKQLENSVRAASC